MATSTVKGWLNFFGLGSGAADPDLEDAKDWMSWSVAIKSYSICFVRFFPTSWIVAMFSSPPSSLANVINDCGRDGFAVVRIFYDCLR